MGQSTTPITMRKRQFNAHMTAEEARTRAEELFASAELLPVGNTRNAVLKEACDFRMLAEMKRIIAAPKGSSPIG
jgi:hypothetical protein